MRSSLLISLSLLLLSWQKVQAQLAPADDFFNRGAQSYISNNIPNALSEVETGLKFYPDDPKLKKLEALLKQQQQQQQKQQNQQQQNQQSSQKDQSSQDQNQQNQSGQKKDGDQKQQPDQKPADENKNGQQPSPSAADEKSGDKKDDQNTQAQPATAGQMTPEEAKRLLDAQKGDEQVLQMKPQGKPPETSHPIKDW